MKEILDEIRRKEKEHDRETFSLCDWDNPEDVAFYRQRISREDRIRVIKSIAGNGSVYCPKCGRLIVYLTKLILAKNKRSFICRTCWERLKHRKKVLLTKKFELKVFPKMQVRYCLNATVLESVRTRLGITQREFAEMAGWSQTRQRQLEGGKVETVNQEVAGTILQVISDFGGTTEDVLQNGE